MLLAGKHSDEINFALIVDIFNSDIFNNIFNNILHQFILRWFVISLLKTLSVIEFRRTLREKFRKRPKNNNKAWIKFLWSHLTHFGRLLGKIYLFQGHNIFSRSLSQQNFPPAWRTDILRNRFIGSLLYTAVWGGALHDDTKNGCVADWMQIKHWTQKYDRFGISCQKLYKFWTFWNFLYSFAFIVVLASSYPS